jgi:stage V sporulation protein AA
MQVQIIGETDVVVEYTQKNNQGIGQWLKILMVCLVCFFGTAFTIMAYHNDVGVRDVFTEVYEIVTHREAEGINLLEVSYCIGLAAGILIFFNHVGNLKLTNDPTPIEVSMKNYEKDVNKTLVEVAERNGEEIDV